MSASIYSFLHQFFPERIMTERSVSIGGRTITNLRFADDIDALAGKEELFKLGNQLDKASTNVTYGMEISAEKTKLMINNTRGLSSQFRISGQNLETVQSFKYLGSVIMDEGSKEICPELSKQLVHCQNSRLL